MLVIEAILHSLVKLPYFFLLLDFFNNSFHTAID